MDRRTFFRALSACLVVLSGGSAAVGPGWDPAATGQDIPLTDAFSRSVQPQLHPTPEATAAYAEALQQALDANHHRLNKPQFALLVDRHPLVQALLVFWGGAGTPWRLLGATPVSTGLPGRYEHFATPLGVFEHVPANPDFRAEGTRNALGIRGYGVKGSRVYDFGWVQAPKGWGDHATGVLRLQMHATDPDRLEPRLGSPQSKGCIRIPASLNEFLDRYGLIDEAYEQAAAQQQRPYWVLRKDRLPTPSAGRYLVVIDSWAQQRPVWSPGPAATQKKR